jgi:hypothetical protein
MATTCCKKCGRELATSARWCPDCGTPLGGTVRCRSCGNEISIHGRGCRHCGARGAAAYGPRSYVIFFGIGLVILLIFGLIMFFIHWNIEQTKRDFEQQQQQDQEWQQREREQQEWRKKHGFEP